MLDLAAKMDVTKQKKLGLTVWRPAPQIEERSSIMFAMKRATA